MTLNIYRVLVNAESGVFLPQCLVLYAFIFLLVILIDPKIFSADASQLIKNTWRRQQESKYGFHPQISEDHCLSDAQGFVIKSLSCWQHLSHSSRRDCIYSRPIRTSHCDRIFNDGTIYNYAYANLRSMGLINSRGLVDFNLFSECVYIQMLIAHSWLSVAIKSWKVFFFFQRMEWLPQNQIKRDLLKIS